MNVIPADIECLWAVNAILGEGLAFDSASNILWFIDIKSNRLYRYGIANGGKAEWPLAAQVTALTLPPSGWEAPEAAETALVCVGRLGFSWLLIEGDTARIVPIAHPELAITGNRFNDGKAGPDGRIYAGTMDDGETQDSGAFYVLNSSGAVSLIDNGYRVTNGPAFSCDGRTLYENDSALRKTFAFDLAADGGVSGKRVFYEFGDADGYPDGMTTDEGGNLWIAMWDGHRIQRITQDGVRAGHIAVPVQRPTTCVLTGPNELVFTSASIGLKAKTPLDGGLFRARFSDIKS